MALWLVFTLIIGILFSGALCLGFVSSIVVFSVFSLAFFLLDFSSFFPYDWLSLWALNFSTDFIFFSFVLSTQGALHVDGHHFLFDISLAVWWPYIALWWKRAALDISVCTCGDSLLVTL